MIKAIRHQSDILITDDTGTVETMTAERAVEVANTLLDLASQVQVFEAEEVISG